MPNLTDWQLLLADLATSCWRFQHRVNTLERDGPEGLARLRRDLKALTERLSAAGVEILDHTGEPYEPGKSLRVLAFQTMPGAEREEICETLKPTIYYGDQWLQMGEVIVGTPESESPPLSAPEVGS
jgi:hypothetical protein